MMEIRLYAEAALRGAGQVVFQESRIAGLLIIIAIAIGCIGIDSAVNPSLPAAALTGLLVSTLVGRFFDNEPDFCAGLSGFNGLLVGCGVMTFLPPTPWSWLMTVIGAIFTVVLRHSLNRITPGGTSYTFPFILTTWIIILASTATGASNQAVLSVIAGEPFFEQAALPDLLRGWLCGISQIFLLCSPLSGLLILAALCCSSPKAALWAATASLAGMLAAMLISVPHSDITAGLYGYSPALTAIAVSLMPSKGGLKTIAIPIFAIVLTVLIQAATSAMLVPFGLPPLTAPFCFATWLTIWGCWKN